MRLHPHAFASSCVCILMLLHPHAPKHSCTKICSSTSSSCTPPSSSSLILQPHPHPHPHAPQGCMTDQSCIQACTSSSCTSSSCTKILVAATLPGQGFKEARAWLLAYLGAVHQPGWGVDAGSLEPGSWPITCSAPPLPRMQPPSLPAIAPAVGQATWHLYSTTEQCGGMQGVTAAGGVDGRPCTGQPPALPSVPILPPSTWRASRADPPTLPPGVVACFPSKPLPPPHRGPLQPSRANSSNPRLMCSASRSPH
eukprot:365008-Chlamydomonas_euryale.AAC.5